VNDHQEQAQPRPDQALVEDVRELQQIVVHLETPSIRPLQFTPLQLEYRDEDGPSAASIGIYNPIAARIYLGLFGQQAGPNSFPVPAESVLILPIHVPGFLGVAIDQEELGESEGVVYLLRFKTPQPFYLGRVG